MKNNAVKLKVAAEEIKDIFRKYEITGSVAMYAEGGYGEHLTYLTAPYSIAYMYNDNELRLYSKREDFPNEEAQRKKTSETAGMLNMLTDCNGINFMFTKQIYEQLETKFTITHVEKNTEN